MMKQHVFKLTHADRMTVRHFRQSLPRSHRAAFDAAIEEILAKEAYYVADAVTQEHTIIVACVICAVREWQRAGHDRMDAVAETQLTVMRLGGRTIRFLMWLVARFSRDPFESIRSYSRDRSASAYGPTFKIGQVDREDSFASVVTVCGYRTILARHGAEDLIQLFCAWDRVWIDALPKGIEFQRPATLANGQDACRFEFRRKQS